MGPFINHVDTEGEGGGSRKNHESLQYGEAKLIPFVNKKGINFASPYCIFHVNLRSYKKLKTSDSRKFLERNYDGGSGSSKRPHGRSKNHVSP